MLPRFLLPVIRLSIGVSLLCVTSIFAQAPATKPAPPPQTVVAKLGESLSAAEFSRLSREASEEGGYFRSDNFTSNETSYLHIVEKLKQVGTTGGAYLGVGPEQNFTYIAKVRPRIAFIVDIRRQAVLQHLMYKAIFQLAPTRRDFLSLLFSKPTNKPGAPAADAPLNELLLYFAAANSDDKAYETNLQTIRKMIQEDFQFPLSSEDQKSLEYVYKSFRADGLDISYRMEGFGGNSFPTLQEILAGTDLKGKQGNFLVSNDDYDFVRGMHRKNLIIPVVGNFGGPKAFGVIGEYLRKNNLTLTAFYTSNVEQYLFSSDIFAEFANNVKKLPINEKSLFIRAVAGRMPHPARIPGHRLTTLLQSIDVFVKDFDAGKYKSYYDLVTTNFIMADLPK